MRRDEEVEKYDQEGVDNVGDNGDSQAGSNDGEHVEEGCDVRHIESLRREMVHERWGEMYVKIQPIVSDECGAAWSIRFTFTKAG